MRAAPFEAVAASRGLAVVYLVAPTTPPDAPRRDRGAERRVPLLRLAGRRDRRPHDRCRRRVGRLVRDVKAVSPVPVGVGFGVSRPAHVRAIAKAGADGVIVASALVDALGPDGRDIAALGRARPSAPCRNRRARRRD